jgi:hypothetical protein
MARVKSTTRVSSGEIHPKATDSASQEAAEVLSSMNQGPLDAVASPSREGSGADASDSDADNGSNNSSDDLSESDSDLTKKAKVAVAATAAGMTFDFGSSTIGKDWVRAMEGLRYLPKGSARAPDSESVPEPRVNEPVVFEDLFAARLCMPPHLTLMDILQKF